MVLYVVKCGNKNSKANQKKKIKMFEKYKQTFEK